MTKAPWLPAFPVERTRSGTVRSQILTLLSDGHYKREEIIEHFQFRVMQNTINHELYFLEVDGEIKYSPRTRTFTRI